MLGLETEYALVFTPELGSSAPVQEKIYEALSEVLRRESLCLGAAYRKEGIFLATGGLLHYEAAADAGHRGLLEMATPECATVRDCIAHHRAQEKRVLAALPDVDAVLQGGNYRGRLAIGKHSADYNGHTFGTHENYQVEDRPGAARTAGLVALTLVYLLLTLPLALLRGAIYAFAMATCLAQRLDALREYVARRARGLAVLPEPASGRFARLLLRSTEVAVEGLLRLRTFEEKRLYPWRARAAAHLVLPLYRSHLVPFLITRLVYTGPGWLRTDHTGEGARFTLSPKAAAIAHVMDMFHDPLAKPILDIKNLLRGATGLLARSKRLHVSYSDTNMSEWALWLKLGTTELVVRMLEAGFVPAGVELADPLAALAVVNADLTFRRTLALDGASGFSALEIQQRYLEMARRYVDLHRHDDADARDVLAAWQDTLTQLAADPDVLADRLDWVAKKDLMNEAIEDAGFELERGWDLMARALPALRYMEDKNIGLGRVIDKPDEIQRFLTARLGDADAPGLDERLRKHGLRWEQLPQAYRLYYQLKKLDLRYHELGTEGGYYQQLEAAGAFRMVLEPAELERAAQEAPAGTRARLRGHYIREANRLGLDAQVSWDRLVVHSDYRVIRMDDPLAEGPVEDLARGTPGVMGSLFQLVAFLPHLLSAD